MNNISIYTYLDPLEGILISARLELRSATNYSAIVGLTELLIIVHVPAFITMS